MLGALCSSHSPAHPQLLHTGGGCGVLPKEDHKSQSTAEEMIKTRIETLSRGTPGLQAKVLATQGEGMSIQDSKDR